jgi:hypothetical protein
MIVSAVTAIANPLLAAFHQMMLFFSLHHFCNSLGIDPGFHELLAGLELIILGPGSSVHHSRCRPSSKMSTNISLIYTKKKTYSFARNRRHDCTVVFPIKLA